MVKRSRNADLAAVGEDRLVRLLTARLGHASAVEVGPGDDAAVIRIGGERWVWTTDTLIEGTHFERSWLRRQRLGRRAYLVNASDVAAMGGTPKYCLVSLAAPPGTAARELVAIQRGIAAAAAVDRAVVVGGNVARASELSISISMLGIAPHPLLRSGARSGDAIYVTGTLGDAALGLEILRSEPTSRAVAVGKFLAPVPRVALGRRLAEKRLASAAMDLSDGLLTDLQRMCRASGVGAVVEEASLPVSVAVAKRDRGLALVGGEDYELLCAVPPRKEAALKKLRPACGITRIGRFTARPRRVVVVDADGVERKAPGRGFQHFKKGSR